MSSANRNPKHILYFLLIFAGIIVLTGCSTKQYLLKSPTRSLPPVLKVVVVRNDSSLYLVIPGKCPDYRTVNERILKKVPSMGGIDTLICHELFKRNIKCEIIEDTGGISDDTYLIRYRDYWNWDLKHFTPVLFVSLENSGHKELIKVVSQANRARFHDYPTPVKQIPKLIDLLLKNSVVE